MPWRRPRHQQQQAINNSRHAVLSSGGREGHEREEDITRSSAWVQGRVLTPPADRRLPERQRRWGRFPAGAWPCPCIRGSSLWFRRPRAWPLRPQSPLAASQATAPAYKVSQARRRRLPARATAWARGGVDPAGLRGGCHRIPRAPRKETTDEGLWEADIRGSLRAPGQPSRTIDPPSCSSCSSAAAGESLGKDEG